MTKQITVKRAVEAWYWIHNNPHHIVGTEWHPTKRDDKGREIRTHIYLKNHHETLRIPEVLLDEVFAQLKPNKRKFDTRMYALKPKARMAVTI